MRIHFWGVRGSIPAPLSPNQMKDKISAVVQRISPSDIVSPYARERFLAALPEWIFGATGGNTSCVEVENASGDCILLDAGSGLRAFSRNALDKRGFAAAPAVYHIFLTHFHWDHIQGIPFFSQIYDPESTIVFYSTNENCRSILETQLKAPYFPPAAFPGDGSPSAKIEYVLLPPGAAPFRIGSTEITYRAVSHPGGCTAYKLTENGKSLVYCTDIELGDADFEKTDGNAAFFDGADILILDSQYTENEMMKKRGWGHSSFSMAVDFASAWNVKQLLLFHFDPAYTDKKIHASKHSAVSRRMYAESGCAPVALAKEDQDWYL